MLYGDKTVVAVVAAAVNRTIFIISARIRCVFLAWYLKKATCKLATCIKF